MTPTVDDPPILLDRARRDAAHWFARARSGQMSKADRAALQSWLREDICHGEAYLEISGLWDQAEQVRADPEVLAMRESALSRWPAASPPPRRTALAAAALVICAIGGAALVSLIVSLTTRPAIQVFRTGVGQTATIGLIDGSRLTLDTDTTVRTQITAHKRLIYLDRGRAYFKVAHDRSRPFVVQAAGKSVTATGTAFEVTAEASRFEVLLVEGHVRVAAPPRKAGDHGVSTDLDPGTRLTGGAGAGGWVLTKVDNRDDLGWMEGQLVFDDKPLGEIVGEMNRYSRRKIIIDDPQVASRLVYGAFMAGDVDQFVRALVDYRIVSVKSQTEASVVLSAP
jgi:transmembrane sensor